MTDLVARITVTRETLRRVNVEKAKRELTQDELVNMALDALNKRNEKNRPAPTDIRPNA